MRVAYPGRILERHVGGNTTYTRAIATGIQAMGIEVVSMPYGKRAVITALKESSYALKAQRNTVLHFSADTGPILSTRTPSIVTVHGIASQWTDVARNPLQEQVWRTRVARAIASTSRVITVSHSSARDISAVFDTDEDSIVVIPHGIDRQHFSRTVPTPPRFTKLLQNPYLLYIGNIEPRKNLANLIRAHKIARANGNDLPPLVIAGKPAWNFREIMSDIESYEGVEYLGFVSEDEKVFLMQHCSLFVFPSHYEGFGFPVLEAMASGAPVACTRAGALAEVAGPAYTLSDTEPDALAADIEAALDMTQSSSAPTVDYAAWVENFTWESSTKRHADLYRELIKAS